MAGTLVTLDVIWEFLSPLISDRLKEFLKPKDSTEIAKQRAFHLYRTLGRVSDETDLYINKLESLVKAIEGNKEDKVNSLLAETKEATVDLRSSLANLALSVEDVNPQLEIHKPAIVMDVLNYRTIRTKILGDADLLLLDYFKKNELNEINKAKYLLTAEDTELELSDIVARAKENRKLIRRAIKNFRAFLANEFSFKESF